MTDNFEKKVAVDGSVVNEGEFGSARCSRPSTTPSRASRCFAADVAWVASTLARRRSSAAPEALTVSACLAGSMPAGSRPWARSRHAVPPCSAGTCTAVTGAGGGVVVQDRSGDPAEEGEGANMTVQEGLGRLPGVGLDEPDVRMGQDQAEEGDLPRCFDIMFRAPPCAPSPLAPPHERDKHCNLARRVR